MRIPWEDDLPGHRQQSKEVKKKECPRQGRVTKNGKMF